MYNLLIKTTKQFINKYGYEMSADAEKELANAFDWATPENKEGIIFALTSAFAKLLVDGRITSCGKPVSILDLPSNFAEEFIKVLSDAVDSVWTRHYKSRYYKSTFLFTGKISVTVAANDPVEAKNLASKIAYEKLSNCDGVEIAASISLLDNDQDYGD